METWKKKLIRFARELDDVTDHWNFWLRQRFSGIEPVQIIPYRSYGTPQRIYIRGRVLKDKGIRRALDEDNLLTNLLNMYKRFETDEVPGAELLLELNGQRYTATTDKEGYFVFDIIPGPPLISEELYYNLPLQLVHAPFEFKPVSAIAEIMIPPAGAEYGIISDIDDTIIHTGAHSLLSMGRTVLLGNARTRLPFPGVSEFYKALQLGRNGKRNNPFFYVSNGPWNLYDLLLDFMDLNEIAEGPLLLRDFGIQSDAFMGDAGAGHKLKEISRIIDSYPYLNFILVGDSGEQDPLIYEQVADQYPGRIIAIYIRDVAKGSRRATAIDIASELKKKGVEMVLTEDSSAAAEHAAASGLIFREKLAGIEQDKKQDEGKLPGKVEV
jgi:phosphatidate phosphatase APP1